MKKQIKKIAKVGDMVRFFEPKSAIWIHDDIAYINGSIIEGKSYDLTYVEFEVIESK